VRQVNTSGTLYVVLSVSELWILGTLDVRDLDVRGLNMSRAALHAGTDSRAGLLNLVHLLLVDLHVRELHLTPRVDERFKIGK
jgi:hypothetical protein